MQIIYFNKYINITKNNVVCIDVFSNSDEIQSVLKPAEKTPVELPAKRNPLKNSAAKIALNPYHAQVRMPRTIIQLLLYLPLLEWDACLLSLKPILTTAMISSRR